MNATIAKALLEDAWRQVVDNRVFRLLVIVTFLPIALTFVIGFQEDSVELLWGWKEATYSELTSFMGGAIGGKADLRAAAIQAFQSVIVEIFGSMIGVIFCISATAFFVPRMMEKGAADTLFSKPVSRFALLLSRYVSGILFVGTLAILLVFGMFLGLWLVSGYHDPGFLWAALTLIYLYGILYSFTIAVATATRSSTAALLLSLILFMFGGCIHQVWMTKEYSNEVEIEGKLARQAGEESAKTEDELRREQWANRSSTARFFIRLLDVTHYVLPKTTEAGILTEELKRDLARRDPEFADEEGGLWIQELPEEFERAIETTEDALAAWSTGEEDTAERLVLSRRPRANAEGRRLTSNRVASEFEKEIVERGTAAAPPEREELSVAGRGAEAVAWDEERDGRRLHRQRIIFTTADWIYAVDLELDPARRTEEEREEWRSELFRKWSLQAEGFLTPNEWFQEAYGWDAPLRFNLFFSIGSSLAFALAMLAYAGLKLRTIDF